MPFAVAAAIAEKISPQNCIATYLPLGPVACSSMRMTSPAFKMAVALRDRGGGVEHAVDDGRVDDRLCRMADADGAPDVRNRDHLAENRRAVIPPAEIVDHRAADERDPGRQILVRPVPVALDVADRDPRALRSAERPHLHRADAVRRRVQIALRWLEVPAAALRSVQDGRGHRPGRNVCLPDRPLLVQFPGDLRRVAALLRHDLDEAALDELRIHALLRELLRLRLRRQRGRDLNPGLDRRRAARPKWERMVSMSYFASTLFRVSASLAAAAGAENLARLYATGLSYRSSTTT